MAKELSQICTVQREKACEAHLEGVVLTTGGDTDPLIIEHRAAQVITPTALQARVRVW
jgi:hypothetical protein